MKLLADIERHIDQRIRGLFQHGTPGRTELIEVERGIFEDLRSRIETLPRGRLVFPYNRVHILLAPPPPDRRRAYELVFLDDSFRRQAIDAIRSEGCEFVQDLQVEVSFSESVAEPFRVECEQAAGKPTVNAAPPGVTLNGSVYPESRIHVGRTPEVLDGLKRPVRRNQVAIDDPSVSRAHAHIEYDAGSGTYRIFDDGSSYGTSILHQGRLVDVPRTGRGVPLAHGDEILVGHARVKFELQASM